MAQFARPASDVSTGAWGATPLYQRLDETNPNDSDYIESAEVPSSDMCEVTLGAVTDPETSGGHIVRYRYCKSETGGDQANLTVRLMQGSTQIASWNHQDISSVITPASQTLSGAQADAISDYTDLRLRFEADTP